MTISHIARLNKMKRDSKKAAEKKRRTLQTAEGRAAALIEKTEREQREQAYQAASDARYSAAYFAALADRRAANAEECIAARFIVPRDTWVTSNVSDDHWVRSNVSSRDD